MIDKQKRVTAANLIRAAVKYMDLHGRCRIGARGIHGEVCPVAAVVFAGKEAGLGVTSEAVTNAVDALDNAARKLKSSELASSDDLNHIARYNEHPSRTDIEVKNFMGHVANQLVNNTKRKVKVNA